MRTVAVALRVLRAAATAGLADRRGSGLRVRAVAKTAGILGVAATAALARRRGGGGNLGHDFRTANWTPRAIQRKRFQAASRPESDLKKNGREARKAIGHFLRIRAIRNPRLKIPGNSRGEVRTGFRIIRGKQPRLQRPPVLLLRLVRLLAAVVASAQKNAPGARAGAPQRCRPCRMISQTTRNPSRAEIR